MDDFDYDPVDDEEDFRPWSTGIMSEHMLTGTIEATGQDAVFIASLTTYAASVEDAKKAARVLFDWLITENGIELQ